MPPKMPSDTNPTDVNNNNNQPIAISPVAGAANQPSAEELEKRNTPLVQAILNQRPLEEMQPLIDRSDLKALGLALRWAVHDHDAPAAWKKQVRLALYKKGATPLMIAILEEKSFAEIEQLIRTETDINATNDYGFSALFFPLISYFFSPAWKNAVLENIIVLLLEKERDNLDNTKISTVMHTAIHEEYTKIIDLLITKHPHCTQAKNADTGNTSLQMAINSGRLKSAKYLIARMSPQALNIKNNAEKTALDLAIDKNQPEVILALLEQGAEPTKPSNNNYTILHLMLSRGHVAIVKFLVTKYPTLLGAQTIYKHYTPLMSFLEDNYPQRKAQTEIERKAQTEMANLLIEAMSWHDLNLESTTGETALSLAASQHHFTHALSILRKAKKDNVIPHPFKDEAALIAWAASNRYDEIVKFYLVDEALVEKTLVDSLASRYSLSDETKINPNTLNNGVTPLSSAATAGDIILVKALLQAGADVNSELGYPYRVFKTALMFAVNEGHLQIVKILIDHNANLEVTNKHGDTILEMARKMTRKGNAHPDAVAIFNFIDRKITEKNLHQLQMPPAGQNVQTQLNNLYLTQQNLMRDRAAIDQQLIVIEQQITQLRSLLQQPVHDPHRNANHGDVRPQPPRRVSQSSAIALVAPHYMHNINNAGNQNTDRNANNNNNANRNNTHNVSNHNNEDKKRTHENTGSEEIIVKKEKLDH